MLMQLCKKLEVGMLLLALFYLFSPLVSVSKTCFFQGVKAGDMIFILVFCLLFVWSWRFAKKESLVFKLSGIDVLLLVCGLYIIVLYLFSWEQLDIGKYYSCTWRVVCYILLSVFWEYSK